jgi:hypothetical protein
MRLVVVLSALLVVVTGCKSEPATPAAADTGSPEAPQRSQRLDHVPLNTPILVVNGTTFTRADLERAILQHAAMSGVAPNQIDREMRIALEKPAYEKMIERSLLANEAANRNLAPSADDVAKAKADLASRTPPGTTQEQLLKSLNTDEAHFEAELKTDIALRRLIEDVRSKLPGTDEMEKRKALVGEIDRLIDSVRAKAKIERLIEPRPSKLEEGPPQGGSQVPAWRPGESNVRLGAPNPHGDGASKPK